MIILSMIITLLLFIITVYLLLLRGPWPNKSEFNIDFAKVRELAESMEGELPLSINILTIATGELPAWGVVAGDFFNDKTQIEFPSFQLVYENMIFIIETPFNRRLFDKFPYGKEYFQDNYAIMQKALLEAECIIPTHEHWDHLGGVAQSEYFDALIKKTIFTKEQINGSTIKDAEFPEHFFGCYRPLIYDKYHNAAPGVILIKAPGHSEGHQFVYVKLKNGNEFLFTGDVVWTNNNFMKQKNRPWLASKKRLENRHQISHQMRYLNDEFFNNKNQKIHMISTHDPNQHMEYLQKGLIKQGFQITGTIEN